MKAIVLFLGLIFYSLSNFSFAADGKLPGDNLDLNAVLDLFKNSKNIEDFENKLNSEKTKVNNLDLNDDGYVDYIRVVDYVKDNAHLITLQVAFTADEVQDVAVIELDRKDDKTVVQIVGDEALYGRDYIIEPKTENERMAYNANTWSSVQYIYGPTYVVYVSPWYYGFYPHWHRPWRPYTWDIYWGYVHPYYAYYRPCGYYRSYHAHHYYYGHKSYSPTYYKSPKHMTAQQTLPLHKQSMTEAQVKNIQVTKTNNNVQTANQRELRKVETTPKTKNTIRSTNTTTDRSISNTTRSTTTPRSTNEPAVRNQSTVRNSEVTTRSPQTTRTPQVTTRSPQPTVRTPQTTRSPQPSRSTTPTMRSPQRTSPSVSPQRSNVRQPATVQPSRSTSPASRTPNGVRRP